MVMKIFRIIRAYTLAVFGKRKGLVSERLVICKGCKFSEIEKDQPPLDGSCGVCGCPFIYKLRDLSEGCPHPEGAKW